MIYYIPMSQFRLLWKKTEDSEVTITRIDMIGILKDVYSSRFVRVIVAQGPR